MRIGFIGYSNHSGLGNYISNFRTGLPQTSQFVIEHPTKGTLPLSIPHTLGSHLPTVEELIQYLDTCHPDIVFIIETPFNFDFFRVLQDRKVKIVYVPMPDCKEISEIRPFFDTISAVINHTRIGHTLYSVELQEKAVYIPYPLDTTLFRPYPDRLCSSFFLHNQGTGDASFRKGTDIVLSAFRQLRQFAPNTTLLFNCQPYETKHSHIRDGRSNRGVTIFTTDKDSPEKLYQNGIVYVAPSRREGLGLPILEAMACGLPVITTDAPPMSEWIKNPLMLVPVQSRDDSGYGDITICTPNSYALLKQMQYAIVHSDEMVAIGKENRKIAEDNFSWEVLRNKYLDLLERL